MRLAEFPSRVMCLICLVSALVIRGRSLVLSIAVEGCAIGHIFCEQTVLICSINYKSGRFINLSDIYVVGGVELLKEQGHLLSCRPSVIVS